MSDSAPLLGPAPDELPPWSDEVVDQRQAVRVDVVDDRAILLLGEDEDVLAGEHGLDVGDGAGGRWSRRPWPPGPPPCCRPRRSMSSSPPLRVVDVVGVDEERDVRGPSSSRTSRRQAARATARSGSSLRMRGPFSFGEGVRLPVPSHVPSIRAAFRQSSPHQGRDTATTDLHDWRSGWQRRRARPPAPPRYRPREVRWHGKERKLQVVDRRLQDLGPAAVLRADPEAARARERRGRWTASS